MISSKSVTSTEARRLIRDGERGEKCIARQRGPTRKTEETVSHRQNNKYVKEVETPTVPSNLCTSLIAVSAAVWTRITKERQYPESNG